MVLRIKKLNLLQTTSALLAIAVLVLAGVLAILHQNNADATLAGFNAGNIISDYVMTNKNSMTAAQIQDFLNSKNPNCNTNILHGYTNEARAVAPCLKDYKEDGQTAAQIIWQAGQDYAINPQVLIILLEKEQGLVSDTWPRDGWWWTKTNLGTPTKECPNSSTGYCVNIQYRSAAGYGCPDNGVCDSKYYGFKNQIRWAAALFHATMTDPSPDGSDGWYQPYWTGVNTIQYNPDNRCGSSQVNIQNRATAALYNYTPYQPNSYALNGGSDGSYPNCGAFGNRNFYNWFTDWFGSTIFVGADQITDKYISLGGDSSWLGTSTSQIMSTDKNGLYQLFQNGKIMWSPNTGAHTIHYGAVDNRFASVGYENGYLGFPKTDELQIKNGVYQIFEGGQMYWSNTTGAFDIRFGAMFSQFAKLNYENGYLGLPTSGEIPINSNAVYQEFQHGRLYWRREYSAVATGMSEQILARYAAMGYDKSYLGLPVNSVDCTIKSGGCWQMFDRGKIYYSPGTGTWSVYAGAMNGKYGELSYENGKLGYPTSNEIPIGSNGSVYQTFQGGRLIWRPTSPGIATVEFN